MNKSQLDKAFEGFWKRYPDRGPKKGIGGKLEARKKFEKALENATYADLIRAVDEYARMNAHVKGEERAFAIKMAPTWLFQGDYLTVLEKLDRKPEPVLRPVSKQVARVSQKDAMNSEMGRQALANGQGANFWLAIERINSNHERAECKNAMDFINDKGGVATRYLQRNIRARESMKGGSLKPKDLSEILPERRDNYQQTVESNRRTYKASIERERRFAEKYGER